MKGWTGKILRVDLANKKCLVEDLNMEVAREYLGGRGLGTKYLFDEIDPRIEPLGPENPLIFAAGPITGTGALGGTRYQVITKSPLTGAIGSASASGFWGPELKFAGYDMIIFEGKAKEPVYLWVENQKVEIRSATHIWGKKTYETQEMIRRETDKDAKVACIGPAGEKLVKFACIINDEGRAAGRTGVGTVMGSKNLKAIAVRGTGKVPVADEKTLKDVAKSVFDKIPKPISLREWGTAGGLMLVNELGVLPTRNFQTGVFEGAENISASAIREKIFVKVGPCYRCPIACKRITKVTDPLFAGEGHGPEYEGLYSLGSCCGIDNLSAVAKAFYMCNELGIDVITSGVTIACAMEMFEKGILKEKDVGRKLNFGNAEALVDLIRKIGNREGFGNILAEGSYRLAERYNHPEFSMTVKKQELAGYEPRGLQGMGLGYAVSTRGACHMRSQMENTEALGLPRKVDNFATSGKAALLIQLENDKATVDSMGLCAFCSSYKVGPEPPVAELEAVTGLTYGIDGFMKVGERVINLERLFNNRVGFTAKDDTLPQRILKEPMPEGPAKGWVNKLGEMLPEYYHLRGWDSVGNPTEDKLKELGIS